MYYRLEKRDKPMSASIPMGFSPTPHIHNHLEMVYLMKGHTIAVADNNKHTMKKGSLFVSFPNQIHYYLDQELSSGYLLIFSPDIFPDLKEVFQKSIPQESVIPPEMLPNDIEEKLGRICSGLNSEEPFVRIGARGYLLALLAEIFRNMQMVDQTSNLDNVKRILIFCMEHYTEDITLEVVSNELHLNKYYISHVFKERMDIGFSDFISSLRLEHACSLLKKDSSITEVAYASGFSSIRTFNRQFAGKIGRTPTEYVKNLSADNVIISHR